MSTTTTTTRRPTMTEDVVTWNLGVGVTYFVRKLGTTLVVEMGGPEDDRYALVEYNRQDAREWTGLVLRDTFTGWDHDDHFDFEVGRPEMIDMLEASYLALR